MVLLCLMLGENSKNPGYVVWVSSVESVAVDVEEGIKGWSGESSQWSAGAEVLLRVSSVVALALLSMGVVGSGIGEGIVNGCRQRWHW